jgi:SAM-dependent methyltransferase
VSTGPVNLYDNVYYDNVYADFASSAEIAVRRETYGEDLGQSSWLTAEEWVALADLLGVTAGSDVLEVGSGSGGPAAYLAGTRNCRVTGVDINQHGVRNALGLAAARGVAERAHFQAVDANGPLPFAALLREAGFTVRGVEDVTANATAVASRWYQARDRHREALVAGEGEANFEGLQRFLRCVPTLSRERRLSRYAYWADKLVRAS